MLTTSNWLLILFNDREKVNIITLCSIKSDSGHHVFSIKPFITKRKYAQEDYWIKLIIIASPQSELLWTCNIACSLQ